VSDLSISSSSELVCTIEMPADLKSLKAELLKLRNEYGRWER
jgi:hypothetical protein